MTSSEGFPTPMGFPRSLSAQIMISASRGWSHQLPHLVVFLNTKIVSTKYCLKMDPTNGIQLYSSSITLLSLAASAL